MYVVTGKQRQRALTFVGILLGIFPVAVFAPLFFAGIWLRIGFRTWGHGVDGYAWVVGLLAICAAIFALFAPRIMFRVRNFFVLLVTLGYLSACYCAYVVRSEGIYVVIALIPLLAFYFVSGFLVFSRAKLNV